MVFVDACRNEIKTTEPVPAKVPVAPAVRSVRVDNENEYFVYVDPVSQTNNSMLVKSTQAFEYAHEMLSARSGVFTHFFVQLLHGSERAGSRGYSPNGLISYGELVDYLDKHTIRYVMSLPADRKKNDETPVTWSGGMDKSAVFATIPSKRLIEPNVVLKTKSLSAQLPVQQYQFASELSVQHGSVRFLQVRKDNSFFASYEESLRRGVTITADPKLLVPVRDASWGKIIRIPAMGLQPFSIISPKAC